MLTVRGRAMCINDASTLYELLSVYRLTPKKQTAGQKQQLLSTHSCFVVVSADTESSL